MLAALWSAIMITSISMLSYASGFVPLSIAEFSL